MDSRCTTEQTDCSVVQLYHRRCITSWPITVSKAAVLVAWHHPHRWTAPLPDDPPLEDFLNSFDAKCNLDKQELHVPFSFSLHIFKLIPSKEWLGAQNANCLRMREHLVPLFDNTDAPPRPRGLRVGSHWSLSRRSNISVHRCVERVAGALLGCCLSTASVQSSRRQLLA